MRISIDECKERTTRLRAKTDCFVKACYSSFHENNDEDLKVIDVSPIRSLFFNMNLDDNGIGSESTFVKKRSDNLEFLDLDAKIGKSGIGEVVTLNSNEPTISDFKEFDYDNCSQEVVFPCCNPLLIVLMLIVKIKLLPNILLMP